MAKRVKEIEVLARGICLREGQILLCRNRGADYWYLPGGHVEPGESAERALRREFLEETGKAVGVGRLVLVHENRFVQKGKSRHEYSFVFEVRAPERIKAREKHLEFRWMEWGQAGKVRVLPKAMMQQVGVYLGEHPINRTLKFKSTRG